MLHISHKIFAHTCSANLSEHCDKRELEKMHGHDDGVIISVLTLHILLYMYAVVLGFAGLVVNTPLVFMA